MLNIQSHGRCSESGSSAALRSVDHFAMTFVRFDGKNGRLFGLPNKRKQSGCRSPLKQPIRLKFHRKIMPICVI